MNRFSGIAGLTLLGLLTVATGGWGVLALAAYALLFAALLTWWRGNEREWQPEAARLARAEIEGDLVTVRNIRNFDHRSAPAG